MYRQQLCNERKTTSSHNVKMTNYGILLLLFYDYQGSILGKISGRITKVTNLVIRKIIW